MSPEPHRSHAVANRSRILEAAWDAFLEDTDASLNAIAKRAGVGIATLYRNFPTREALVLELYRSEVAAAAAAAPRLLAEHPPLVALRRWMEVMGHYGMTKAGMADALYAVVPKTDLTAESYDPIIGALRLLLDANEEAGTIRRGVDADDVLIMMGFLWRLPPGPGWRKRAAPMLDLLINGLTVGAPGEPAARQTPSRARRSR